MDVWAEVVRRAGGEAQRQKLTVLGWCFPLGPLVVQLATNKRYMTNHYVGIARANASLGR